MLCNSSHPVGEWKVLHAWIKLSFSIHGAVWYSEHRAGWHQRAGSLKPLKSGPVLFLINGLSTALQLKCTCFHAGSHFLKKTPSLWDAAVFRHQTTCLCFLFSSLHRRGPRLSANRRCFVSEVTETKWTLNFGRSLCHPLSGAAQATQNTEGISYRGCGSIRPLYGSQMCWLLLIFHFLCHS